MPRSSPQLLRNVRSPRSRQVYEQMIQQIEEDTGTLPPSLPRGVAPETAAANSDVQAIIVPRLTMLMEIAYTFLSTIIESLETVPYGIRWICKQIRSLTRVSGLSLWTCSWPFRRSRQASTSASGFDAP